MTIDDLIQARSIDRVQRSPGHASKLLAEAERHVKAAALLVEIDPVGAYQLAYDAARKAAMALLADRGLRPTARGGHVAVVSAIEALSLDGFERLDTMRRRRNKLEYPTPDGSSATANDARAAIAWADEMCTSAGRSLGG